MSKVRVHNFAISLDGFGTGAGQSREMPFGHAGERLHDWYVGTQYFQQMRGESGGTQGVDNAFARQHDPGIGAEIMGANKFGPPGWQDDADWTGWWGPNPPFHSPTFVMTHRPPPPIEMAGGTTFYFVDAPAAEVLEQARAAANGADIRLGGGATVIREFLTAGLIDYMHLAVVPIVLGRGERLWDNQESLEDAFDIEAISTPSGVTHLTFIRKV
ncbi:dihydrofolate reductase family protein [Kribbella monticola]|uniref:dihydrofolate reductase family protein n=1 Tax=Kribbella monticola TaxID=2185285 RepID=UPI000DD39956|nr:dihydrofolate reductase family protein [Kribbella monticola]